MRASQPMLVVVVRPGRRTHDILRWLRQLLPAALLVVAAPAVPPPVTSSNVIVLDDDDVPSGPLSLADALARHRVAPAQSVPGDRPR